LIEIDDIDESFVPRPIDGLEPIAVGSELVLVAGWSWATVLNDTGALIWSCFDGEATLGEVIAHLSGSLGVDADVVRRDTLDFARHAGAEGLLEGVAPPGLPDGIELVPLTPPEVGEVVALDDPVLADVDGIERSLAPGSGRELLLVNWNPECGFCATIAERLAELHDGLAARGIDLVLVATGDAEPNRAVSAEAGLQAPVLLLPPGVLGPFRALGTPAAYHLDVDRHLVSPVGHGAVEVKALAERLAGADAGERDEAAGGIRYLLAEDGSCSPNNQDRRSVVWLGTRTYRIGDHHVGLRYGNEATASVLDSLFRGAVVDDRRAGHSYSVSLAVAGIGGGQVADGRRDGPGRDLNLLMAGSVALVRSRSPARVVRALLSHLADEMVDHAPDPNCLRVAAPAAVVGGAGFLLPPGGLAASPHLQARLAREGVALADVPHPEVDLATLELVIPEPEVSYDAAVVEALAGAAPSALEQPAVAPGRYPLVGWGALYPAPRLVTELTVAEAATAALPTVLDPGEPAAMLLRLAELFTRVRGFGIWYDSDKEFVAALVEALT
jgi:hypothetical protein